jgi:lysophospholipase L1-like esterase
MANAMRINFFTKDETVSAFSLFLLLALAPTAATHPSNGIPARITDSWKVEVGPGKVILAGREIVLKEAVSLNVPAQSTIEIRNEKHDSLPVFNPNAGGWTKGAKLKDLITVECTATGLLLPESVQIKGTEDGKVTYRQGTDFEMDGFWATVGRVETGPLKEGQPVWIDYDYVPCRLDSVVVDSAGQVKYVEGKPGTALVHPPNLSPGEKAILNIWLEGKTEGLTDNNLFPIEEVAKPAAGGEAQAEKLLPKTLAKLRSGGEVTIVAWGDSVTEGGGVETTPDLRYQNQFAKRLGERFPKAKVHLLNAGWGGRGSRDYLEAPRGGAKDFIRDVIDPKPDIVTIEFVNDAYLNEELTQVHYKKILDLLEGNGSEVILMTPHLVRPDWMQVSNMKFDEDPRPYVHGLHRFAKENGVALADASSLWCALWRQGIPYLTLEANSINHPDARGHQIFADALMGVFPEK